MNEFELPLVFFTVFCQWAVGTISAMTLLCHHRPQILTSPLMLQRLKKLALAVLVVNCLGSLASLLHLGSPLRAYRAVFGIKYSWLSREVVAFIILNTTVILWAGVWTFFNHNNRLLKFANIITSLIGLGAICVSAQVYYQMANHPLWNSATIHVSFIATCLLLGFISVSLVMSYGQDKKTFNSLPRIILWGAVAGILLTLWSLYGYSQGLQEQSNILLGAMAIFGAILLAWLIVAGIVTAAIICVALNGVAEISAVTALLTMMIILSGAICGRMLFYYAVMSQSLWF